jgi:secondary thiamine-phosphate synthase enzyme
MREFRVQTHGKTELIDITSLVREAVDGQAGRVAVLYVPHRTAGILIQANGSLAVARDVGAALVRIVDEDWDWQHTEEEGERNLWSHVRAALTATSVTIPLADGALVLGNFQSIFLREFDGPRHRTVYATVL